VTEARTADPGTPSRGGRLRSLRSAWRTVLRQHPGALAMGAWLLGLGIGWWLLGWWLVPVQWTDAAPGDLAFQWQVEYARLVAAEQAQRPDGGRARTLLQTIPPDRLSEVMASLVETSDTTGRQQAELLAEELGIVSSVAPPAAAATGATAMSLAEMTRFVALLALVAVLAAAAALSWAWVSWRRQTGPFPASARSPDGLVLSSRDTGARTGGAPPWRPQRVDLGRSFTARYHSGDERFYQTWLVYDERGGLVGGSGLQAHQIGSVNTLDLWFFKRDEEGDDVETPTVTIVSLAASRDGVFRARLGRRTIVAAVPGQTCTLAAADLALDARIQAVDPDPDGEMLGLSALTLALVVHRVAPAETVEDGEPPVPLPFRRD